MNKSFLIFYLFIALLTACSKNPSNAPSEYMAFENIEYVEQFPQSFSISNGRPVEWNLIGMRGFEVYDSLLIVSTTDEEGFWSFYQSKDLTFLGKFLKQGLGPNEFIFSPSVEDANIQRDDNHFWVDIYDPQTGHLFGMDIERSLAEKQLNISSVCDTLPKSLFNYAVLDSNTLYCREIANEQTQQIRYLSRNGQRVIPKNFEQLNQAKVRHDENFNLLSTLSRKSPSGDFIIEVPISLHQVNLYATDGNFGKTLCFKKQLENLRDIENENKWERFYTYSDIRTYNTFWGVLQVDETNKDWQLGRKHLPVIQLFDYQGNPIAELKMDRFITSFDIDFNNGALYTLDYQEDEFYKYDIQDILIKCNIDDNE